MRGGDPAKLIDDANRDNKMDGLPYGKFVKEGLLRNLKIAEELGLLTPEGLAELRRGNSATITTGPYAGQDATVDHIIPRSICPELDNQIFNLELLPSQINSAKNNRVTDRARVFANELYKTKLISEDGFKTIMTAYDKHNDKGENSEKP